MKIMIRYHKKKEKMGEGRLMNSGDREKEREREREMGEGRRK